MENRIKLKVLGITYSQIQNGAYALVLAEEEGPHRIPIIIGTAEAQAIARAHRIGQDKQVIAYRFITQNSIEEKILQLQEDKRRLAETFITDSDALPALSNEQWADLLE